MRGVKKKMSETTLAAEGEAPWKNEKGMPRRADICSKKISAICKKTLSASGVKVEKKPQAATASQMLLNETVNN